MTIFCVLVIGIIVLLGVRKMTEAEKVQLDDVITRLEKAEAMIVARAQQDEADSAAKTLAINALNQTVADLQAKVGSSVDIAPELARINAVANALDPAPTAPTASGSDGIASTPAV